MIYYTGIGARETPQEYIKLFTKVALYLSKRGCILRSGGANGSDLAFESGVIDNLKEIYLPWNGFNGSRSNLVVSDKRAFEIAEKYHPYWYNLKEGGR